MTVAALTMAQIYRPEYVEDPYPLYRLIREISPVYWDRHMGKDGAWMVTGYPEALETLRDARYSAYRPQWSPEGLPEPAACPMRALHNQVFVVDPPQHSRLRKLMTKPFLPKAVELLRPRIEQVGQRLLDRALESGDEFDFMNDFAMALPSAIVCELLGVPPQDRERLWRFVLSWGLLVDENPLADENPEYHLRGISKYMDYFRDLVAQRRDHRTDDLIQVLADGWADGEFDSEEELLGNIIFLFTAGQTTTAHQIGNTALSLLANDSVLAEVTADPSLVAAATPEFMRYDCSVQLTKRRATTAMKLAGERIEAGQELFVWLGAAHRDPRAFTDPDTLDPARPKSQHLALGHGIHYCVGGQLGQLVNEVAIRQFVERVPRPSVDLARVKRTATPTFRGPHAIPMAFG
ncbi:MAG: cytochrome P450 [Actinomycetota bacterium]|nr:cytochrome P450 [Actinomycetota bacterium]